MTTRIRFLAILWAFITCNLVLFQNFTTDGAPSVLHNDLCKQGHDLNESRILQVKGVQADLNRVWPKSSWANPTEDMANLSSYLFTANQKLYEYCVSENAVLNSHEQALIALRKVSDPEQNKAWKNYLGVLDLSLKSYRTDLL